MRRSYTTDLSDEEWAIIQPYFQTDPRKGGRPIKHPKKEIVNAILYVLRSGCAWRLLPHDFPAWKTVYNHFRDWQILGVWERMSHELTQKWRRKTGRRDSPTAAIIDSQSVKTTEKGGSKGMMEQRKSREEKGIFSSTLKGTCWEFWSMQQVQEMVLACLSLLRKKEKPSRQFD